MKKLFAFLGVVLLLVMACASSSPSPRSLSLNEEFDKWESDCNKLSPERKEALNTEFELYVAGLESSFETACDPNAEIETGYGCPVTMYILAKWYDRLAYLLPENIANYRKQAIKLYRRLIREFPDYRAVDDVKKRLERLETLQPETMMQE
jgi:hypothetical protein